MTSRPVFKTTQRLSTTATTLSSNKIADDMDQSWGFLGAIIWAPIVAGLCIVVLMLLCKYFTYRLRRNAQVDFFDLGGGGGGDGDQEPAVAPHPRTTTAAEWLRVTAVASAAAKPGAAAQTTGAAAELAWAIPPTAASTA